MKKQDDDWLYIYARKTSEAAIDALEQELRVENLSAEDRIKITEQIQKIKAELAQKEAEIEIDAIEKVNKADDKAHKERIRSLQKWLQTSSQVIGTIGDLIATLYDGQIEKIEEWTECQWWSLWQGYWAYCEPYRKRSHIKKKRPRHENVLQNKGLKKKNQEAWKKETGTCEETGYMG